MGTRQRSGANDPRATSLFLTRAHRLWLEKTNPEQAKRNDFAEVLTSKSGKDWTDGGDKHRVYFEYTPLSYPTGTKASQEHAFEGYFDVKSGDWHKRSGGVIDKDDPTLKRFLAQRIL